MADDLDLGATLRGYRPGMKVFGRFTLKNILGRGGMGVVWLARDEQLERAVALKFLPEILALDQEAIRDLKRETRRSLELTHSHIVRIYDFVQDATAAAISMEYIAGETLAARKVAHPRGYFEVAELRTWVRQLGEALGYAHEKARVVHRDLKPANLMIDARGDLRVADFGIAASVSDSVSRVSVQAGSSGTPVYMSPQQMMGEAPAVSDDVYAVGATLFDLLTGKPPFYRGNVVMQVQGKPAPTVTARRAELGLTGEAIPAPWEEAIAACLAKDPASRPASVEDLVRRLLAENAPARGEDMSMKLAFTAEDLRRGGSFEFNHQPGLLALRLRVQVPAGTRPGQILRVRGSGRPGRDGGESGDLLITVEEQAPASAPAPAGPPPLPTLGASPALGVGDVFWSGLALTGSLTLLGGIVFGLLMIWNADLIEHWRAWEFPLWLLWLGLSVVIVHRTALQAWPDRRALVRAGLWSLGGLAWLEATYWYYEYWTSAHGEANWHVNYFGAVGLLGLGRLIGPRGLNRPVAASRGASFWLLELSQVVGWAALLTPVVTFWPLPGSMMDMREPVAAWMTAGGAAWLTLWRHAREGGVGGPRNERDWRPLWLVWAVMMSVLGSLGLVWFWAVGEDYEALDWDVLTWIVEGAVVLGWLGLLLGFAAHGCHAVAPRRSWWIWGLLAVVGWAAMRLYLVQMNLDRVSEAERFLYVIGPTMMMGLLLAGAAGWIFARPWGEQKSTARLPRGGVLGGLFGAVAAMAPVSWTWVLEYQAPLVLIPGAVILTVMIALVYALPRGTPAGAK
jgi:uncharacterized membrane protein (UPF0136 family)